MHSLGAFQFLFVAHRAVPLPSFLYNLSHAICYSYGANKCAIAQSTNDKDRQTNERHVHCIGI